jgi:hypothetical protein
MLRSVKQLYREILGASDGEIGRVKEFDCDDQQRALCHLVADTDSWLPGRKQRITPHARGRLNQAGKPLPRNLTRDQIEHLLLVASIVLTSLPTYESAPDADQGQALPGILESGGMG